MRFVEYCDIEQLHHPENESIFVNPDDDICIEEKIDGGCFCFFIEDGNIHLCSRHRDLVAENDEKTFSTEREWLMKILAENKDKINPNYFYYGEILAKHTIAYPKEIPKFIGFDIKPKEGAFGRTPLFIGRKAKEELFQAVGVPCVDLKGMFKAREVTDELLAKLCEKSAYGAFKPEGCVMKNYGRTNVWGRQMFAKMVLDEFKETNRAVFGGIKKDNSDTIKLVDEFCTDARIRKRILALTTEGGLPLDRKMMHILPIAVAQDIFKEETPAILKQYKDISLGTLKQIVAKKCLTVLDKMMVEAMPPHKE